MAEIALKIVFAVVLPTTVFVGGAWIMSSVSGRPYVERLLSTIAVPDQKPLNQRFGYTIDDVDRHWGAFAKDARARSCEQHFLEMDLVFPFFYGTALATSLLMLWALLDRSINPAWMMAPVVLTLLADWTENLVQIFQFRRYVDTGKQGLNERWIQVASVATILKLTFFILSSLLIVSITVGILSTYMDRRTEKSSIPSSAA